jgi:DeoR family transcriptional regulator, myo-inositol catabolism operon repressor
LLHICRSYGTFKEFLIYRFLFIFHSCNCNRLKLQRIQRIEEYLKKAGSASLDDLCQQFGLSKNTIRRYLNELEARSVVKKVYGGVVLNGKESPIPLAQRQLTMHAEKAAIARKAAEFVKDGDIIIIDAGSTTAQIVEHLKDRANITIITNSIPVINAALGYDQLHVIVTGGDLLRPTNSFVGWDAIAMLKKFNAKTVFLAATGVSLAKGITNSSTIETAIKKTMIEVSAQVILLVDHTKFDTVSLVTFAELKDLDTLITDTPPPPEYSAYCAEHGVNIMVAEETSRN